MLGARVIRLAKDLWREAQDDNVLSGAASIAFFLFLSIFPAAIFLISLIPYLPVPHLQQAIMDLLHQVLPKQSAYVFEEIVRQAIAHKNGSLLTFGLLFTVWSASMGIFEIIQQLNLAYDVRDRRPFWKVRGISILLMFVLLALTISALSLVIFGGVIQGWLGARIGWSAALLAFFATFRWIIIISFLMLGFDLIYYFGPDLEQKFRLVSSGSLVGTVLIALATLGFRLYISNFGDYGATYGSLGAAIILMLWLYLAGIAILIGGEINSLVKGRDRKGHSPEPQDLYS